MRNYTTNIFFLWIDWPLLEGYNITDTQADAIAWAFTDFIWEKIQNEYYSQESNVGIHFSLLDDAVRIWWLRIRERVL